MKPPVEIELRVDQHRHRPGELIEGQVVVTVNQAVQCQQLAIALQNTSSLLDADGNVVLQQDHGQTLIIDPHRQESWLSGIDPQALFAGDWDTDKQYCYPIELTVPGPASYQGRHFHHGWLLQCHALFDTESNQQVHATAIHPLQVIRLDSAGLHREIPSASSVQQLMEDAKDPPVGVLQGLVSHGFSICFVLFFGLIPMFSGAIAVILAILDGLGMFTVPALQENTDTLSLVCTGVVSCGFGCYMLPLLLDSLRGDCMQLYIAPLPLTPGDDVQFVAMIHRSLASSVESVTARIACTEHGAGPGTEETCEVLYQQQVSLPANIAVQQGTWLLFCGKFHLPADLPASIEGDFGDIEYTIHCDCTAYDDPVPLVSIDEALLVI
jgi:hypothetical protein